MRQYGILSKLINIVKLMYTDSMCAVLDDGEKRSGLKWRLVSNRDVLCPDICFYLSSIGWCVRQPETTIYSYKIIQLVVNTTFYNLRNYRKHRYRCIIVYITLVPILENWGDFSLFPCRWKCWCTKREITNVWQWITNNWSSKLQKPDIQVIKTSWLIITHFTNFIKHKFWSNKIKFKMWRNILITCYIALFSWLLLNLSARFLPIDVKNSLNWLAASLSLVVSPFLDLTDWTDVSCD